MSDNRDDDKKDGGGGGKRGKVRATSPTPSAVSTSSGLEWDPSADIGTQGGVVPSATLHPIPVSSSALDLARGGPGRESMLTMALEGTSTDGGRPPISRSQSYEHTSVVKRVHASGQQHQSESSLRGKPQPPHSVVDEWKQRYLENHNPNNSFLEAMVGTFATRRQFIQSVQQGENPERPESASSHSVSTVMPPGQGYGSQKILSSSETEDNSLPKDLRSLDSHLKPGQEGFPRTSSTAEVDRVGDSQRQELKRRSASMIELALDGSTTAPTATTDSARSSKFSFSGLSGSVSRNKPNVGSTTGTSNERRSTMSEWLDAGMTKSEKDLQKQKDSGRSSSMLFVALQQDYDERSKAGNEYTDVHHKNVGIQTQRVDSSSLSSIYQSTPLDTHRRKSHDDIEGKKPRRRCRSPPQPFAAATRKSPHHHHGAHHSRNNDTELSSLFKSKEEKRKILEAKSSSELSPPCFVLEKLVKSGHPGLKDADIVTTIEQHRSYHIKKIQHEFRQLEKLENYLYRNRCLEDTPSSESDEHLHKKGKSKSRSPRRRHDPQGPRKDQKPAREEDKSSSTPPCDSPEDQASLRELTDRLAATEGKHETALEKDMAELVCLLRRMMEKNEGPSTSQDGCEEYRPCPETDKPKKVKRPVAYFLPFPNCNGEYVFRKVDLEFGGKRKAERKPRNSASTSVSEGQKPQDIAESSPESCDDDGDEDIENRDPCPPINAQRHCLVNCTLQDALQCRCPNFYKRMQQREAVLQRIKCERQLRAEKKREWARTYVLDPFTAHDLNQYLPPKGPRLMTTKEMRERTKRNYQMLPEVQTRALKRRADEEKKTNRIMSQVFAQHLRKEAQKGGVNFVHSRSLVRR